MELRGPQPVDGEREREVGEREGEREREIRRGIGLRGGSTHPIKLPNPDYFLIHNCLLVFSGTWSIYKYLVEFSALHMPG